MERRSDTTTTTEVVLVLDETHAIMKKSENASAERVELQCTSVYRASRERHGIIANTESSRKWSIF